MTKHVVIAGGGLAGMSAATYLAEAGYRVTLCESTPRLGGKAKSGRTADGNPTEHSLRIYSTDYKTLLTLMARIPTGTGEDAADGPFLIDRLVRYRSQYQLRGAVVGAYVAPRPVTPRAGAARPAEPIAVFRIFRRALYFIVGFSRAGVPLREGLSYVWAHLRLLFRSPDRMAAELSAISYGEYLGMKRKSPASQRYFTAVPLVLTAARDDGDAYSIVNMVNRLLFQVAAHTPGLDHLELEGGMMLNGPTSERLIEPWVNYLVSKGVDVRTNAAVSDFAFADGRVRTIVLENGERLDCDYAILAVPYPALLRACERTSLGRMLPHVCQPHRLRLESSSGSQFFLKELPDPHPEGLRLGAPTAHLESPWCFVSVLQGEGLWKDVALPPGTRYVLSATWSFFDAPGVVTGKPAWACSPDEMRAEAIAQCGLDPRWIIDWHPSWEFRHMADEEYARSRDSLPPHIAYEPAGGRRLLNFAPLVITQPGAASASPRTRTEVENLFLAGEATWSDELTVIMPTMEKAANTGFLAAREVLAHADPDVRRTMVLPESEPLPFSLVRKVDDWFWRRRG